MSGEKVLCPLLAMYSLSGIVSRIIGEVVKKEEEFSIKGIPFDRKEFIESIIDDAKDILNKIAYCRKENCPFYAKDVGCILSDSFNRLSLFLDNHYQSLVIELRRPMV